MHCFRNFVGKAIVFGAAVLAAQAAAGREKTLYTFTNGTDGAYPFAGLAIDKDGNLYGTTLDGGTFYGTVYEVGASGSESIPYVFGGNDGFSPGYGLTRGTSGNLYGTTTGGDTTNYKGYGCGTVFEVAAGGKETILYAFLGGADGSTPYYAPVLNGQGNLYGTAEYDGANGYGTIYAITNKDWAIRQK